MFVPELLRKCVAFIGIKDANGKFAARATAFFVTIESESITHLYLVTAAHCPVRAFHRGHKAVWLRVNLVDGGVCDAEIDFARWVFHPAGENAVDVAVLGATIDRKRIIYSQIPIEEIAVTASHLKNQEVGVGDEVCIPGLFVNHSGIERNIPIVRTGKIAAFPEEPIRTAAGNMDAYLIEAMSIGGLSGSPVFFHNPPIRSIKGEVSYTSGKFEFLLLGLVHGHYDVQGFNDDIDSAAALGSVNAGIAVVTPVEKILETLFQDKLKQERAARAGQYSWFEYGPAPTGTVASLSLSALNGTLHTQSDG